MSEPHTFHEDCWCNTPPRLHEDDSYGACVVCREYVAHTEDEWRQVAFPCAVVRAKAAEEDAARLRDSLTNLAVETRAANDDAARLAEAARVLVEEAGIIRKFVVIDGHGLMPHIDTYNATLEAMRLHDERVKPSMERVELTGDGSHGYWRLDELAKP